MYRFEAMASQVWFVCWACRKDATIDTGPFVRCRLTNLSYSSTILSSYSERDFRSCGVYWKGSVISIWTRTSVFQLPTSLNSCRELDRAPTT